MAEVDYFARASKLGGALIAGQDAGLRAREAADISAARQEGTRGLKMRNDDAQYASDRARAKAARDAAAFPLEDGPPLPAAPSAAETGMGGLAPEPGAGTGLKAPTAAADGPQYLRQAAELRRQSSEYGRAGEYANQRLSEAAAEVKEIDHIVWEGRQAAKDPEAFKQFTHRVNRTKELPVSFGTAKSGLTTMRVTAPNGEPFDKDLSQQQKENLVAAGHLLDKGFHKEAYAMFGAISAELGATVESVNKQMKGVAEFNNGAAKDGAKMATDQHQADSSRMNAESSRQRVELDAQRDKRDAAKDKSIPPPLLEKYNGLVESLETEQDPAARARIITQVNAVETQIANALGKPRGLPAEKAVEPGEKMITLTSGEKLVTAKDGTPLYKYDEDGKRVPPGKDPWATRQGQTEQAEWTAKGVLRGTVPGPGGKGVVFGYMSENDPGMVPYSTPEEAEAAGKKAAAKAKPQTKPDDGKARAAYDKNQVDFKDKERDSATAKSKELVRGLRLSEPK